MPPACWIVASKHLGLFLRDLRQRTRENLSVSVWANEHDGDRRIDHHHHGSVQDVPSGNDLTLRQTGRGLAALRSGGETDSRYRKLDWGA